MCVRVCVYQKEHTQLTHRDRLSSSVAVATVLSLWLTMATPSIAHIMLLRDDIVYLRYMSACGVSVPWPLCVSTITEFIPRHTFFDAAVVVVVVVAALRLKRANEFLSAYKRTVYCRCLEYMFAGSMVCVWVRVALTVNSHSQSLNVLA